MTVDDKIFVAGHKGLAGSAIVTELLKNGFKNIVTKTRDELNLCDISQVKNFFNVEKPNVTILAAAKVGGIQANNKFQADFIYQNLTIQNNVIWSSFENKVHRLVFLGSSCIYPRECAQPIKEEYLLSGKLESTNQPYAVAKISGIELINSLRKQYGCDYFCVMPTNLFGPNDNFHPENSHVFASLIRKFHEAKRHNLSEVIVWGDGSPLREFMYSSELSNAIYFLASQVSFENFEKSKLGREKICHINIGSGREISIKELANLIASEFEFKGNIIFDYSKPNGTPRKLLDCNLLKELGWTPSLDFKECISKAIRWYNAYAS